MIQGLFSSERALTVHSPAIPEWSGRPALVPLQLSGSEGINELTANRIEIKGQEEVLMNGGGSWQRWAKEGISRGTSGSHTLHAARHDLNGPASMPLQAAPETALYNEMLVLHDKKGRPVANFPYRITLGNGRVISGITDSQGRTQRVGSADAPVPLHIDRQTEH